MSGNVYEWCWDWYDSYPDTAQTDYRGAASGTNRVLRGGNMDGIASTCIIAKRDNGNPNLQNSGIEFRVVRP